MRWRVFVQGSFNKTDAIGVFKITFSSLNFKFKLFIKKVVLFLGKYQSVYKFGKIIAKKRFSKIRTSIDSPLKAI
jgi:hypothetical protein